MNKRIYMKKLLSKLHLNKQLNHGKKILRKVWVGIKKYKWHLTVILIILILIIPVGLYFVSPIGSRFSLIIKYLPYPVAKVQGDGIITTKELLEDTDSIINFYKSQDFASVGMRVDFSTPEGEDRLKIKQKDVLDKLIENRMIQVLAEKKGLKVTPQEAKQELQIKVKEFGNAQALELNLLKLYGWNLRQFSDKVVVPQMYTRKLAAFYSETERKKQPGYEKITKAKQELKKDGSNFEEIVKKYSEGDSAQAGGELGWFRKEQLVPEVAEQAFSLKAGTISDVIQSSLGYHIIEVQELRDAAEGITQENAAAGQENKKQEVKIRQIFVRDGGFLSWLEEQKKQIKVTMLLHNYRWDQTAGKVVFREQSMNIKEDELRLKSQGDPSMR